MSTIDSRYSLSVTHPKKPDAAFKEFTLQNSTLDATDSEPIAVRAIHNALQGHRASVQVCEPQLRDTERLAAFFDKGILEITAPSRFVDKGVLRRDWRLGALSPLRSG